MSQPANGETPAPPRVLVAQIGARRHYAVPRILHQAGMLGCLHMDICATKSWPGLLNRFLPERFRVGGLRRLLGRVPKGIPPSLIRAETQFGWTYARRLHETRTATEAMTVHLWAAEEFCKRVVRRGIDGFDRVYVYTGDGLEILREARRLGIPSIIDQTIPARENVAEMFETERARHPELVGEDAIDARWPERAAREKEEWKLADLILCGSPYVRESIGIVGGPIERAIVVPTGVESLPSFQRRQARPDGEPTRVLFVGEVGFRKGAHYLLEAAERLGDSYQIRFCGRITLPASMTASLPANVEMLGIVPRADMPNQYAWADVFCLPSLLEGSAAATYEAMAAGLPLVTTPNSGSLTRDGLDGFIVPPGDVDALVGALERVRAGELPSEWSPPSERPGGPPSYTLEAYRERLVQVVDRLGPNLNRM